MLLLGVVKEIHDYELLVCLPNGMVGFLPITNVSAAYTQLLISLTEGSTSDADPEVWFFGLYIDYISNGYNYTEIKSSVQS